MMIEDYYICFDSKALQYAQRHFANSFTKVLRCYTVFDVEMIVKTINANKKKNFYGLRKAEKDFIKTKVESIEILAEAEDNAGSSQELSRKHKNCVQSKIQRKATVEELQRLGLMDIINGLKSKSEQPTSSEPPCCTRYIVASLPEKNAPPKVLRRLGFRRQDSNS